ncbi:hypothetical protein BTJ08_07570 [Lactobacillus delbrueckii subsp. bulgaricus]|nr:hypothetical protein [Lactobacillus delbrueckii subsp. bulgaricus]
MKYRVSDLADLNIRSVSKNAKGVIYYIDTSSVFQGHFREANRYSAIADAPSRARRLAQEGDTVISMVRPSNEHIGFIDFDTDNYVFSTGFVVVHPNSEIVEPFYLYLLLSLDSTTRYLQQIAETSTTAYPSVKVEDIGNLSFDIPEISKQRKIVHKIRIIEQKIKLNQEINDNLAETKSAIFNELFDSKLANGLNGKLQDITDLKTGKRPKSKFNQRDSKAIYPIIGATKVMGFTTDYLYDESVITIGRVGTHGVVQRYREPIWVSDNTFIFLSEHEDYLYELLSHRIKYSSLNVGSTQPLITQSDLKNVDIYVPTKQEFSIFEERTSALTKYQFKLNKQNSTLKALQNSLLDKYF